ncbi:hypothetical protein N9P53_03030 [Flavobacteriaceae bacterium]|nr:hypothetical protein [Flavobacteriaceae bacterium]|tara:strand:- start:73 stop:822 length:750 start_codon:yes stop_codon:yes gene_type:complete
MDNLTDFQKKVLNKLLPLLKKTVPEKELKRICKVYKELIENNNDDYLYETFCKSIESNLFLVLKDKPEFYSLDFFEQEYNDLLTDYNDVDEDDFIEQFIDSQNQIITREYKFQVDFNRNESIEVMQFVSEEFYKEFDYSARAKIKFLEGKLNPYPLLFTSGKVYNEFISYESSHIIDYYLDYSYLKKRLEATGLIHRTKDNDFMKIIHDDMGLINETNYQDYLIKNKLSSLKKSTSASRENNFKNTFLS